MKYCCTIDGCKTRRNLNQILCPKHWRKIAQPLRDRVWKQSRVAKGKEPHLAAIRVAVWHAHDKHPDCITCHKKEQTAPDGLCDRCRRKSEQ